jgi:5-methylcytosine-specific restriction protein A
MPTINLGTKAKKIEYPKNDINSETQRIYNSKMWKRLRLYYLKEHPLCENCLKTGKLTSAKEIHHIIEINKGADLDQKLDIALNINNLMSLCVECHHQIHNEKFS